MKPKRCELTSLSLSLFPHVFLKVIFKAGDDLRQDQLVTAYISLCAELLSTAGLDLDMPVYRVLATGAKEGLIEVVPNAHNISSVLEDYGSISMFLMQKHGRSADDYKYVPLFASVLSLTRSRTGRQSQSTYTARQGIA